MRSAFKFIDPPRLAQWFRETAAQTSDEVTPMRPASSLREQLKQSQTKIETVKTDFAKLLRDYPKVYAGTLRVTFVQARPTIAI